MKCREVGVADVLVKNVHLRNGDVMWQVKWAHGEGQLKTKKMLEDKAWRMLQVWLYARAMAISWHIPTLWQFFNNRDDPDVTNGMSVPVFMDWLEELDPIISINDTCGRASAAFATLQLTSRPVTSCAATSACCCAA